ncbi:hypothetical protein ABPG75_003694 [Micractinium tetrahymenae]
MQAAIGTKLAVLFALLLVAFAAAAAAGAAASGPRPLTCPPSIIGSVLSCSDSGTVVADSNVTYSFVAGEGATGAFDLVFSLHTQAGDADLVVLTPAGAQLVSMHGSGEDVVFIGRQGVLPGEYLITVMGSSEQSSYKLTVEKHERQRTLAAGDGAALEEILHSHCCSRPGSCASLRNGLMGTAPGADPSSSSSSSSSAGSAGGGGPYSGADDLCNMGRNLCDVDGRLVHLALVNEYMACPFPAALGELSSLTLLDLTMNDLSGFLDRDVAAVVSRLPALQNLRLAHNRLSGSLSCDLVAGPLAELDVAANLLEGPIPPCIAQSAAIQELYLGSNQLVGPLAAPPPGSKLLIISAHSNHLSGGLPDVSGLPQLEALVLNGNEFSGQLPQLPGSMRHVNLERNSLSGSIPAQWGQLEGLQVLRLRHNELTGSLPPGLARQADLELLLLGDNQLAGQLPAEWQTPLLQRLDVQSNGLTGTLPAALGSLPALAVLQAGRNKLSGSLEAFAQAAAGTSRLEILSLEGNQLEGPFPQALQQLPLLASGGFTLLDGLSVPATLDLGGNQLSGPFPAWLAEALLHSNAAVNLEGNRLTCPEEITVTAALMPGRTLGLECLSADGTPRPINGLIRVAPPAEPQQPQQPQQEDEQAPGQAGQQEEHEKGGAQQHDEQGEEHEEAGLAPASAPEQPGSSGAASQQAADSSSAAGGAEAASHSTTDSSSSGNRDGAAQSAADSSSSSAGSGGASEAQGSPGDGGSHHIAAAVAALGCLVVLSAVAGPRLVRALQSRRRGAGRYEVVLPRHGSSSSPLASPNMWAKEQQLALLDHSSASRLALPKHKAWAAPRGHGGGGGSGGSSPVIGMGAGLAASTAGTAAEQEGPFSIGTRVHRDELEPADLV